MQKHSLDKGKHLEKDDFQKIIQEVIIHSGFTGFGSKDTFLFIFGIPLITYFIKQRVAPKSIPNEVFIPGVTSASVYLLAKLNKIWVYIMCVVLLINCLCLSNSFTHENLLVMTLSMRESLIGMLKYDVFKYYRRDEISSWMGILSFLTLSWFLRLDFHTKACIVLNMQEIATFSICRRK